jgi:PIN domain
VSKYLIFIDTNIWLDFYRFHGREADLSILTHVNKNLEHFIATSQVEMEFKKNRQGVLLKTLAELKPTEDLRFRLPAFLANAVEAPKVASDVRSIKDQGLKLRARLLQILKNPTKEDPVYRTVEGLFQAQSLWHLKRGDAVGIDIEDLAEERFKIGSPPRKDRDATMGDAINWEWIVHCATESGADIVIVTRDSDYGVTIEPEPIVNDWLLQEFHERVKSDRELRLTDRLSAALKLADIKVTKDEENAEERLIKERNEAEIAAAMPWQVGGDPNAALIAHWRDQTELRFRAAATAAFYSGQTPIVLAQSEPAEPEKPKTDNEPK